MFEVEDRHWWYVGNHENFLNVLKSRNILKSGISILDAGCGTGGWLQVLKNSYEIKETGIDNREIAIKLAGSRDKMNLVCGDINTYKFKESSFDLITCFDVIYHRDVNDDLAIKNFNTYLKKEGCLLLTVPAYSFLRSKHDDVVHTDKRYTKKQIKQLVEKNGFEVVKLSYCMCLLFPIALIKRFFDKLTLTKDKEHNEVEMPSGIINKMFLSIMRIENFLINYISLPFGLSVMVLAKKVN